jgi:hypothetical protein
MIDVSNFPKAKNSNNHAARELVPSSMPTIRSTSVMICSLARSAFSIFFLRARNSAKELAEQAQLLVNLFESTDKDEFGDNQNLKQSTK